MHQIWNDPWMLQVLLSIVLALAFYIYIMFFVARFGRRDTVVPPPRPGGSTDRLLKWTIIALGAMAIILVFFVPTTFTETRDEPFTGYVERGKLLDYSRSARVASSVYYEYFVNLTGCSQNMIRGTLEETEGEPVDLYILKEEEFQTWLQNGTARSELTLCGVMKETVSFSLVPVVNIYYVVVTNAHSPNPGMHYTLLLEHFRHEWSSNVTRSVTRQTRETLFQHWMR